MVKLINNKLSGKVFTSRTDKESSQIIARGKYQGYSFPDIIYQFTEKVINKRIQKAEEEIEAYIRKKADMLFRIMIQYGLDQTHNPFPRSYGGKPWPSLSLEWLKYKKKHYHTQNFWVASRKLQAWLSVTNPRSVFGDPIIKATVNPNARGRQWGNFYINLFPNLKDPKIGEDAIKYRLFGHRKTGNTYISNDKERPILIPSIQLLMRKKLDIGIRKIFKEAVENG